MADLKYKLRRAFSLLKSGRFDELFSRIMRVHSSSYPVWQKQIEQWFRENANFLNILENIQFSIIMPVYKPSSPLLNKAIQSVRDQTYTNWQLCITDDGSKQAELTAFLESLSRQEPRIRFTATDSNRNISQASNAALALAEGEFVLFLDQDDEFAPYTLAHFARAIKLFPSAQLLYSDEDKIDSRGIHVQPYFKPDWNPELFNAYNYINHCVAIKRELVCNLNGFRVGFEGAQDWDLLKRVVASIADEQVVHIPMILYHWRMASGSTAGGISQKPYVTGAQKNVLHEHFKRNKIEAKIEQLDNTNWKITYPPETIDTLVSIIIPTRNQTKLLQNCVSSILDRPQKISYELVIVDNDSDEDAALDFLKRIQTEHERVRVLSYPGKFNFSAINNFAAKLANGNVLMFLNNDVEVITSDWLELLLGYAQQENSGAVGCMLYYPDKYIQHAGIILGIGGVAANIYQGTYQGYPGQFLRAQLAQNLSAVTGACMMVPRDKFEKAGGFDSAHLSVAFNDVDLCLRLNEAGYRNIWTPYVEMYHHESVSRGFEDSPEKKARFVREVQYMRDRWGMILDNDPAYNPNLSLKKDDFSISLPARTEWLQGFWGATTSDA